MVVIWKNTYKNRPALQSRFCRRIISLASQDNMPWLKEIDPPHHCLFVLYNSYNAKEGEEEEEEEKEERYYIAMNLRLYFYS